MDYYGVARTSYFVPNDMEAFKKFVGGLSQTFITYKDIGGADHCALIFEDGIPRTWCVFDDWDEEEFRDIDISEELQNFLQEGPALILQEAGHEGMRYAHGYVCVITQSSIDWTNLDEWADQKLKELGSPKATKCAY